MCATTQALDTRGSASLLHKRWVSGGLRVAADRHRGTGRAAQALLATAPPAARWRPAAFRGPQIAVTRDRGVQPEPNRGTACWQHATRLIRRHTAAVQAEAQHEPTRG